MQHVRSVLDTKLNYENGYMLIWIKNIIFHAEASQVVPQSSVNHTNKILCDHNMYIRTIILQKSAHSQ